MKKFAILLLILGFYRNVIATNEFVQIYYYGWFEGSTSGHWNGSGPAITPTNVCPQPSGTVHNHGQFTDDIREPYFPVLGKYNNTTDTATMATHRTNIINSGAKGVILSYGSEAQHPNLAEINTIVNTLTQNGSGTLKVSFAIRDYPDRDESDVRSDITGLLSKASSTEQYRAKYNNWIALSPTPGGDFQENKFRPIFYLYNPTQSGNTGSVCADSTYGTWGCIFRPSTPDNTGPNPNTNRTTVAYIVLAQNASTTAVFQNGYDGTYTYNPAIRDSLTTFGNKTRDAWDNNYFFSAGVGPGYSDGRSKNTNCLSAQDSCESGLARSRCGYIVEITRARKQTNYGSPACTQAPHFVSVVTFNEWEEGTQIEPALTNTNDGTSDKFIIAPGQADNNKEYLGYFSDDVQASGHGPNLYLNITNNQLSITNYVPIHRCGGTIPDIE